VVSPGDFAKRRWGYRTLVPAYATTIHKSQGSEYPAVVIPVMTQHYPMLQRNLLYTGVTRGKRLVVLVG
jgi:exodeoxyribonuclease V alpha subunit